MLVRKQSVCGESNEKDRSATCRVSRIPELVSVWMIHSLCRFIKMNSNGSPCGILGPLHPTYHTYPLQWRHNERDGLSNHQHLDCLLNRFFFRRWSKKTSKLHVTGIHQWTVISPHKGPVTLLKVSILWRHHALLWTKRDSSTKM